MQYNPIEKDDNNKINNSDQDKQQKQQCLQREDYLIDKDQQQKNKKQTKQKFKDIVWQEDILNQEPGDKHKKPQQKLQKNKLKICLALTLAFLSLLSVQIQMQHYAPFVRTVQCFFNFHILQHQSQDIYEAANVIYYRTAQYYLKDQVTGFFLNYKRSLDTFFQDSFFNALKRENVQIRPRASQSIEDIEMMIIYDNSQEQSQIKDKNKLKKIIFQDFCSLDVSFQNQKVQDIQDQSTYFCRCKIDDLEAMFNSTAYLQIFYQYLQYVELTTYLPINYRGDPCYIKLKAYGELDSGLLMSVKIQTDLVNKELQILQKRQKVSTLQQDQPENLKIRKLPNLHDMALQMSYLKWVIFALNFWMFFIQLISIAKKSRQIDNQLIEQRKESYLMVQELSNQLKRQKQQLTDKQTPQYLQAMRISSQVQIQKQNMMEQLQEPIQITYKERLERIGRYNVIQLIISFLVLVSTTNQGLVSLFCWIKLSVYLSSTGNNLMLGFLFKKTLPLFIRVIISIMILLSAFVFFSMIVYQNTKKFENVQLAFYEYLFNYFQYGIYQNFMPIRKYGGFFTLLYFIHMIILVSIGNQILQSLMARQILKNSNMKSLLQLIESIQVQCPVCGCLPEIKKKLKVNIKSQNIAQKRFISKYFQTHERQEDDYEIQIVSPKLSPLFHKQELKHKQKNQRKFSKQNNLKQILSPIMSPSPLIMSPYSPGMLFNPPSPFQLSPQRRKKVRIEIGQTLKEDELTKFQELQRKINIKKALVDDMLRQFQNTDHKKKNKFKQTYIGFFKQKLAKINKLISKIQVPKFQ